jgi:DNA-binding SARP family transcriptional activator/tetratricopeptide (TPR) repeat protein
MLSIQLFGPPELRQQAQPLTIPRRKSRALLYYLAATPEPVRRERVLALLWPHDERPEAQHSLRSAVHGLRQILGPVLQTRGDSLALAPMVEVDARRLHACLTGASPAGTALGAALALYRGPFLEAFSLPDSPAFDDWVTSTREHYHQRAVEGLHALAQQRAAQQDLPAALALIQRASAFDPLREDIQRTAMQLQYQLGDRAGAIRRFEQLRRRLDEELGLPPMPETQAFYDALITDTLASVVPPVVPPQSAPAVLKASAARRAPAPELLPFTGRATELAALQHHTATLQLVLIEGEPGVGKTRLAQEFAASRNARVLVGAAHELERALPYQPIRAALRALLSFPDWPGLRDDLGLAPIWQAEVARLVPELALNAAAHPVASGDEGRLWEGVGQFLRVLARQQPLVLLLDDLQWADGATLGLLGALVRASSDASITFLATTRSVVPRSPLAALIQDLTRGGRLARVALGRLVPSEVEALARQLSPGAAAPLGDWLLRTSEGHPFVLSELVREARACGRLRPDGSMDGAALIGSAALPQSVTALVQGRLAQLSVAARRLLDIAVLARRVFAFDLVAAASGLNEEEALDALDELRLAGLVVPYDGRHYAVDHSLTMQVATQEAGPLRQALYHRRLAEALEQHAAMEDETLAERLALHWAAAGQPRRAAPYALRAGERAARLAAWREAVAFFEQALAAPIVPRHQALLALGRAQYAMGEVVQAAATFRDAIRCAEAEGNHVAAHAARLELGITYLPQAKYQELVTLAQQARASDVVAQQVQAELLWGTALAHAGRDLAGATAHLRAAELLMAGEAQSDPASLAHVLFELGCVAAQQGELELACARYRAVLAIAQDAPFATADQWAVLALNNLAYHLHLLGDAAARSYAEQGMELAGARGLRGLETYLRSTLGEIALAAGELDAAEAQFRAGLALAEARGQAERVAGLGANLGRVAAARGQVERSCELLSQSYATADALGAQHLAVQIRLWLAPLLPLREARARLAEARRLAGPGQPRLRAEIERQEARLRKPTTPSAAAYGTHAVL